MYKLSKYPNQVLLFSNGSCICIPFDPDNTDYQTFKKQINEGTAQLEDAEGNLMTEQQAKDFVATLP